MSAATCRFCQQVMAPGSSCLPMLRDDAGGIVKRVPYGGERGDLLRKYRGMAPGEPLEPCRDCGVLTGDIHHFHCCLETCPKCGGQLLMCLHSDTHHDGRKYAGDPWDGPTA